MSLKYFLWGFLSFLLPASGAAKEGLIKEGQSKKDSSNASSKPAIKIERAVDAARRSLPGTDIKVITPDNMKIAPQDVGPMATPR